MKEQALVFACEREHLLGVLTPASPDAPAASALADVGVVIIVGGPQYRAGSHRQYVQLARSLAGKGVSTLRFDTRGMGDSSGEQRTLEEIEPDVGAAIQALQLGIPGVKRVVLWGLCGGASAALLYWRLTQDKRVHGMVLVNPWVRSEETLARTHLKHYYLKRLGQADFWSKLLRGGVPGKAIAELVQNVRLALGYTSATPVVSPPTSTGSSAVTTAAARGKHVELSLQGRMAQAWQQHPGHKLVVLSGNDYTAKEFVETAATDALWRSNLAQRNVSRFDVDGADHTFSDHAAQRAVEEQTFNWLLQVMGSHQAKADQTETAAAAGPCAHQHA